MNLALDTFSSGMTRQQLQAETVGLKEKNETLQAQVESTFRDRHSKEEINRNLEQEIEREKNKVSEMIYSLSPADQNKYKEYQLMSEKLRQQNMDLHTQIEEAIKQKEKMSPMILNSQTRIEAVRLQTRLRELIQKRNTLREEEMNRLSPGQEREKLIEEVRANNQALTSIGRQMKIIEEQLSTKKETLQQVEQDLEEGNSERHAKYMELKKRDEVMTMFMENFEQNMKEEKKSKSSFVKSTYFNIIFLSDIKILKNQIMYAIEQISLQGLNTGNLGKDGLFNEKNDLNSQNGLVNEYKRLGVQLKQLQLMEKRTSNQVQNLRREETEILGDIQQFRDVESLRSTSVEKMGEMTAQLEELKKKRRATEGVYQEAVKRNKDLKEILRSNETYRQISHLEEKLNDLLKGNKNLQESVDQFKKEYIYEEVKTDALNRVNDYNTLLCNGDSLIN